MPNQSAISVTGVGPRHAFTINGTGAAITCDNVVGTGLLAGASGGTGEYHITHNLGKTGYCVNLVTEMADGAGGFACVFGRGGNTFGIRVEDDGGSIINPNFVHGAIYD